MDIDDSFTEKVLQQAKATREYISSITRKRRSASNEDDPAVEDDFVSSPEESPKRQCLNNVSYSQEKENVQDPASFVPYSSSKTKGLSALKKYTAYDGDEDTNREPMKRECLTLIENNDLVYGNSTSKIRGLAALKKKCSNDSDHLCENGPHQESTSKYQVNNTKPYVFSTNSKELCSPQIASTKLRNEILKSEEISNPGCSAVNNTHSNSLSIKLSYANRETSNHSKQTDSLGSSKPTVHSGSCQSKTWVKQSHEVNAWDQAIAATLETQGFVKSPVKAIRQIEKKEHIVQNLSQSSKEENKEDNIENSNVQNQKNIDPAELPLSARKALFEKAFLQGSPKKTENAYDATLSVAQRAAMFEKVSTAKVPKPKFLVPERVVSPVKLQVNSDEQNHEVKKVPQNTAKSSPLKKFSAEPAQLIVSPNKNVGSHTLLIQQKLIQNANIGWQQKDTASKVDERRQELSSLVNHWEQLSSSSSLEKRNYEEEIKQENFEVENSFESDVTSEENASDCDESVCSNQIEIETDVTKDQSSSTFEQNDQIKNDFKIPELEENLDAAYSLTRQINSTALRENVFRTESYETCSDKSASLSSYSDESYSVSRSHSSTNSVGSDETVSSYQSEETSASESKSEKPLLYTLSLYRKQKQEIKTPPVRTIVRKEQVNNQPSDDSDQGELIQDRIQALQEEILRQQTVIKQTSEALNLCRSTAEFCGSTEQVEAERLLLIATQKRQACLNEIQRCKTYGAKGGNVMDGTGTLTITGIQLPLKREFIAAQLEGKTNETVHYFLCLIRFGAQVIVTQMMSTSDTLTDGALCFTNHIKLQNLPADFSVVCEVYGLQGKKEVLPHEKKYHIRRDQSKIRLTPKSKKVDGKMILPAVSSPGGPNAVRTSSFGVIGYTRFTLQNSNKNSFTLDAVPIFSPLEGKLQVKLSLHAEHKIVQKGFLTMFEDVSGFGAWHRRWCALDSVHLLYWKYPDDEHKKEPMGVINLKQCVTSQVKLVSRDICARSHTFQLITVRPQERGDKNTLISSTVNTLTTTKHLMSADTKEERILWCDKLNEALVNVRKWDPHALRPITG